MHQLAPCRCGPMNTEPPGVGPSARSDLPLLSPRLSPNVTAVTISQALPRGFALPGRVLWRPAKMKLLFFCSRVGPFICIFRTDCGIRRGGGEKRGKQAGLRGSPVKLIQSGLLERSRARLGFRKCKAVRRRTEEKGCQDTYDWFPVAETGKSFETLRCCSTGMRESLRVCGGWKESKNNIFF